MISILDRVALLLSNLPPLRDQSPAFKRIDGRISSNRVVFLPWGMSLSMATRLGIVPARSSFLACYEMPEGIISSDPQLCVRSVLSIAEDFSELVREQGKAASDLTLLGLSIGNFPATYIANKHRAKLISIAGGDAGDAIIWESAAAAGIKAKAMAKGFGRGDFAEALRDFNPISNLSNLAEGSVFVLPLGDALIPEARRTTLLCAAEYHGYSVETPNCGHVSGLVMASQYLER